MNIIPSFAAKPTDWPKDILIKSPGANPLWAVRAEIEKKSTPSTDWQFRNLFISRTAPFPSGSRKVLPPGTILATCRIREINVNLDRAYTWKDTSAPAAEPALLLLQADPASWRMDGNDLEVTEFICIAGEIPLAKFEPTEDSWQQQLPLRDPQRLTLHSSGLSLTGGVQLPWDDTAIEAPFHVGVPFDVLGQQSAVRVLHMALDRERLDAVTAGKFIDSFRKLADYLLPAEPTQRPRWASLELASRVTVPKFHLQVRPQPNGAQSDFRFEREELHLLLSDQALDGEIAPRSLCRSTPETVVIEAREELIVRIGSGGAPGDATAPSYSYNASRKTDGVWDEQAQLRNITSAYDPLETALLLRQQYDVPEPDLLQKQESPALLWGFAPLEDGWAQLPFMNLTEQIYLDAFDPERETNPEPLLFGAFAVGNDAGIQTRGHADEQPWSVTLLNADLYSGEWRLEKTADPQARWRLKEVTLLFQQPEVVLNGFLWLATAPPTTADALPSLDNWLAGLRAVSLRTLLDDETFPAPFTLRFEDLKFRIGGKDVAPVLQQWQFIYEANQRQYQNSDLPVFKTLVKTGKWTPAIAPGELWHDRPLVWRRHPRWPAIQALPLTQNQQPPNYPSPSRQLAPFALPVDDPQTVPLPLPKLWRFGVAAETGAAVWPRLLSDAQVAAGWKDAGYLWLAALSLPGLAFDPDDKAAPLASDKFLAARYLFGLPYTDELNALAQLPKESEKESPPDPLAPAPEPVLALQRADYERHWQSLAERAFLAQTDRDEALVREGAQTFVQGLVEPYTWPVTAVLNETSYPGALTLSENGKQMVIGAMPQQPDEGTALRGLHGEFNKTDGHLTLTEAEPGIYSIVAGAMAAQGNDGRQRDQRGLWRGASEPVAQQSPAPPPGQPDTRAYLLKTFVEREGTNQPLALCSLLRPLELLIDSGATDHGWKLWFRDVPVFTRQNGSASKQIFDRADTRSPQARGVNDTESTARERAHLTGYEWRLAADQSASQTNPDASATQERVALKLLGLAFYPLTLDKVELGGDGTKVTAVEIVGRLQLPAVKPTELTELNNAVRVRFEAGEGDLKLVRIDAAKTEPDAGAGAPIDVEWPLSDNEFAVSLLWQNAVYSNADGKLTLSDARLEFSLFGVRWQLPAQPLTFPGGEWKYEPAGVGNSEPIALRTVQLHLSLADPAAHMLTVALDFRWGGPNQPGVHGAATIKLLGEQAGEVSFDVSLNRGDLAFSQVSRPTALLNRAVQVSFSLLPPDKQAQSQLLPGMHLSADESVYGVAVMTFAAGPPAAGSLPKLEPRAGFLELVLPCEWGKQLQEPAVETNAAERVFGSSAGRLYGGYTLSYDVAGKQWLPKLLLNGFLEVKNLISWPAREYCMLLPQTEVIDRFKRNEAETPAEDEIVVAQFAELLRGNPELTLQLEGHTDDTGPEQFNVELSLQRAKQVKERILAIAGEEAAPRITAQGFSSNQPRVPNDSSINRALNRRVEIKVSSAASELEFLPSFTVPAARRELSGLNPSLDHLRHTMRVLFNQHELPKDLLNSVNAGAGDPLFDLPSGSAWQFLAVVEHQLIDVQVGDWQQTPLRVRRLQKDRRWTAVQEVRLITPQKFSSFLDELLRGEQLQHEYLTSDPTQGARSRKLTEGNLGYHRDAVLNILLNLARGNEVKKLAGALLVEASAPHWVRLDRSAQGEFTGLQYLERGAQRAILSVPDDFASRVEGAKPWMLLPLPFLGRLQARHINESTPDPNKFDELQLPAVIPAAESYLRFDPLLLIQHQRQHLAPDQEIPQLPLALASWADRHAQTYDLSALDLAPNRRWDRLDPATLEESWYRVQNPPAEDPFGANDNDSLANVPVPSVLKSLPTDSPGRLSRPALLTRLFDPVRFAWPPRAVQSSDPQLKPADVAAMQDLVWRRDHLFVIQGVSRYASEGSELKFFGFFFTGAQIYTSPLAHTAGLRRHISATMFPASLRIEKTMASLFDNRHPVSFAVSPYLGLEFQSLTPREKPLLSVTELLCLNPAGDGLGFVTSQIWEWQTDQTGTEATEAERTERMITWGSEVHGRLAADSPIAILRVREVIEATQQSQPATSVVVKYRFLTLSVQPPITPMRRTRQVRVKLDGLRFADGQFGGEALPGLDTELAQLFNFEVAPPQVIGVQPLYLASRPLTPPFTLTALSLARLKAANLPDEVIKQLKELKDREHNEQAKFLAAVKNIIGEQAMQTHSQEILAATQPEAQWPWGLSALRFSIRHTKDAAGVAGRIPQKGDDKIKLWWSALAHEVQFAFTDRHNRRRLLPSNFRARAVRSLLSTVPDVPLPAGADLQLLPVTEAGAQNSMDKRLLAWQPLLPGSFRYSLLGARAGAPFVFRHHLLCHETTAAGQSQDNAVFTSGGVPVQHRAPRPVLLPRNSQSESAKEVALRTWASYFRPTDSVRKPEMPSTVAGREALADLAQPADNAFFATNPPIGLEMKLVQPSGGVIAQDSNGELRLRLRADNSKLSSDNGDQGGDWNINVELVIGEQKLSYQQAAPPEIETSGTQLHTFLPAESGDAQLSRLLAGLPHGAELLVKASVGRAHEAGGIHGYRQQLSFPLRLLRAEQPTLPLQPVFLQFEDPEYNRRLASITARASAAVLIDEKRYEVNLATDRREYNPASQLFAAFFITRSADATAQAPLQLKTGKLEMIWINTNGVKRTIAQTGVTLSTLLSFELGSLAASAKSAFAPGDVLQLSLSFQGVNLTLTLRVDIVAKPVLPTPEAGYALLRQQPAPDGPVVECARFAWSPQASRIELVNPDDLAGEIVRRRAVFQWTDSVRPRPGVRYEVQKMTFSGSTHIPRFIVPAPQPERGIF